MQRTFEGATQSHEGRQSIGRTSNDEQGTEEGGAEERAAGHKAAVIENSPPSPTLSVICMGQGEGGKKATNARYGSSVLALAKQQKSGELSVR